MASINYSVTTNPKELAEISKFVIERVKEAPEFNKIHKLQTGVKMKEQIGFASQFSMMGIADNLGGTRPTSGAGMTFTEKFWECENVGDTIPIAIAQLPQLFKAWGDKLTKFKDQYDASSNNEFLSLITLMMEQGVKDSIMRVGWLGDKGVVEAGAGTAGLIDLATNGKFYNPLNGLWDQIFTLAGAGDIGYTSITQNGEATKAAQYSLPANTASAYFEQVYGKADSRLIADPERIILCNRAMYDNYRQELQAKGVYTNLGYTMFGFVALDWNGIPVINADNIWNRYLDSQFAATNANLAYYLPNRIVFTTPSNIPMATLNEADFGEVESHFEWKDRATYLAFGYTLDAKVLENYLISVAY